MTTPEKVPAERSIEATAEFLGVEPAELDYITPELLAEPTVELDPESAEDLAEADKAAESEIEALVTPPNRISYLSHWAWEGFTGTRTRWSAYANCQYHTRYHLWGDQINRYVVDGSCRTPMGTYVDRYKVWWHTA